MFLLHPRVAQLLNLRSIHTPFAADGLSGSVQDVLHAQQANRLLAFGQQCLASSGGTASLCGGAAGPGGGPAGALCAPFSGAATVAAGGSNGGAGGVPVGGQEIGRQYPQAGSGAFSPYAMDDQEEVPPILIGGGSAPPEDVPDPEDFDYPDPLADSRKGLTSGFGSVSGAFQNNMPFLSTHKNKPRNPPEGCPTCHKG